MKMNSEQIVYVGNIGFKLHNLGLPNSTDFLPFFKANDKLTIN